MCKTGPFSLYKSWIHMHDTSIQSLQAYLRVRQVRGGSSFMEFSSRCSGMASWLLVVECGKQWPARSMSRQLPTLDGRLPHSSLPLSSSSFSPMSAPATNSHRSLFLLPAHSRNNPLLLLYPELNPGAAYCSSLFTMAMRYPHYPRLVLNLRWRRLRQWLGWEGIEGQRRGQQESVGEIES